MKDWTELVADSIPKDIFKNNYDFKDVYKSGEQRIWGSRDIGIVLKDLFNPIRDYMIMYKDKIMPSHKERMTKWWLVGNDKSHPDKHFWDKVSGYSMDKRWPYFIAGTAVNKDWFVDKKSADIPPEVTE